MQSMSLLPKINGTQAPKVIPRQGPYGVVRCCCMLFSASAYHSYAAGGVSSAKRVFCLWWLWPLTLTFEHFRARHQTRLPCEFGANPFSCSQDIARYWSRLMQHDSTVLCFLWWPWPLTLTLKLVWSRVQTRPSCKFGTNTFSHSEIFEVQTKKSQR